jgi:hypothetical protein
MDLISNEESLCILNALYDILIKNRNVPHDWIIRYWCIDFPNMRIFLVISAIFEKNAVSAKELLEKSLENIVEQFNNSSLVDVGVEELNNSNWISIKQVKECLNTFQLISPKFIELLVSHGMIFY